MIDSARHTNRIHDDLHAIPGSPADFFALLAVVVADAVGVFLVKLFSSHMGLGKFTSEESNCIVQGQANSLN